MKFTKFETDALMKNLRRLVDEGTIKPLQTPAWRDTQKQWEVLDRWTKAKSPFYRCYTGFIESVRRIDFSRFEWKPEMPIDPVAIELPETVEYYSEYISKEGIPLDSDEYKHGLLRIQAALLFQESGTISAITYGTTTEGRKTNGYSYDVLRSGDGKHLHLLGAIAIGMSMVKDEADLFKPVLLRRDEGKPVTEELIKRAIRNGVFGFDVGEALPTREEIEEMKKAGTIQEGEKSPHFRTSYFGLRWTGPHRKVPRLVKIKECLVGFRKITTVPTGYYEKECE